MYLCLKGAWLQLCLLALCHVAVIADESLHNAVFQSIRKQKPIDKKVIPVNEKNPEFWRNVGRQELEKCLRNQDLNKNRAKNIIFFMGDGMSLSTVTAARMLQGQRKGQPGEEEILSFEKFPYTGISKTYCTNAQVSDSACAATAYMCGVKGNMLTVGVTANVEFNNCSQSMDPKNHVSSIAAWAQKANKSTGFITTTTLTHASPSGAYAHAANRMYESDTDVESFDNDPSTCMDIATQLVTQEPGCNFDIIMGGGMSKFLPNTTRDVHGNMGVRKDGKNLLSEWANRHPEGVIISNRNDLLNLTVSKDSQVMGIFQSEYMDYHLTADASKQPTLTEMVEQAIKLMKLKDNGYFLFVEGALIDVAHHDTKAALALDETLEFAKAIQRAREITNEADTLIVTTADHGHPLTITGYPVRGNDILGLNTNSFDLNGDKYLTLNYAMGPKQYLVDKDRRVNMEEEKITTDFQYPGYIHGKDSHHSGEDVVVYASGPFAHLFTGVIEESTIPYIMAYAACLGDGLTMCHGNDNKYN